jgi:hypothetical protein
MQTSFSTRIADRQPQPVDPIQKDSEFPPVAGMVTKAIYVEKTGGEETNGTGIETSHKTPFERGVSKDTMAEPTNKGNVKLPDLADTYGRIHDEMLKILQAKGLPSIVERKREDPIAIKKQLMGSSTILGELLPFNTKTYKVEEGPGINFHDDPIIAFHIPAVVSLLTGTNPSRKCMGDVLNACKKVKKTVHDLCDGDTATIKLIMDKILTDHVESANRTYHLLLQVSKSPGMCKVRAPVILAWVVKLEHDAREYFEILRKDMIIQNMQATLALNSVVPMRRNANNDTSNDEDDFDA